jgi:hypothetical protein
MPRPICFILLFCLHAASLAAAASTIHDHVQVRYESFTWREYDSNGRQLLKESGYRVGLQWDRASTRTTAPSWSTRIVAYLGDVDYDGRTQLGTPIESTTEYHGLRTEALVNLPVAIQPGLDVAPFAGLGGHTWLRRLDNTGGFAETGYDEWWVHAYGLLGLDARWQRQILTWQARVGVRFPGHAWIQYDFTLPDGTDDAQVDTDHAPAWFGELGVTTAGGYVFTAFAEQVTYDRSDSKTYGAVSVFQPESEMTSIGLTLGVRF